MNQFRRANRETVEKSIWLSLFSGATHCSPSLFGDQKEYCPLRNSVRQRVVLRFARTPKLFDCFSFIHIDSNVFCFQTHLVIILNIIYMKNVYVHNYVSYD